MCVCVLSFNKKTDFNANHVFSPYALNADVIFHVSNLNPVTMPRYAQGVSKNKNTLTLKKKFIIIIKNFYSFTL